MFKIYKYTKNINTPPSCTLMWSEERAPKPPLPEGYAELETGMYTFFNPFCHWEDLRALVAVGFWGFFPLSGICTRWLPWLEVVRMHMRYHVSFNWEEVFLQAQTAAEVNLILLQLDLQT